MIQKISARQGTGLATMHKPDVILDEWGKWHNDKYYQLQVVQHPIRARMCGFGDKDRRPLAPAAVLKMIVKKDDNTILEPDEVDCSFFVVTVDLWSLDGKEERNLVLHPTSNTTERFNPAAAGVIQKLARKHAPSTTAPSTPPEDSVASSSFPSPLRRSDSQQSVFPPEAPPTWGYGAPNSLPNTSHLDRTTGYPPPSLPSISTFSNWSRETNRDPSYQPRQWNSDSPFSSTPTTPFHLTPHPQSTQSAYNSPDLNNVYSQTPPQSSSQPPLHTSRSTSSAPTALPFPAKHTYTRTLVGPLSCNATRLLDEHRKPGIFFLFQDLSVRTEGIFRLRMRLMNVGAPPVPESGSMQITTGTSPILAQTFSQPFTVFSAKRFPGVPDTTALSIALGNQGQKLPLRNRHGSGKRRRLNSDDEDDSDGS